MNTENTKFANGPATTVKNLLNSGAVSNLALSETHRGLLASVPIDAILLSPENFTKPPRGIIENCHSVPFLSLNEINLGPKPMLKTDTSILLRRATKKCPNSCTKMTTPNANAIAIN